MDYLADLSEIQYFYKNKTILLTGATSYIGKLLLEKILRLLYVKRVYLILRGKDGVTAETRCAQILDSQGFAPLKRNDPEFYKRVALIEGDLEKPQLGIRNADKELILKEVDCIFHCALSTRVDENLRKLALVNVRGTSDLMDLAMQNEQLAVFAVLSSVYSNYPKYEVHERVYETNWNYDKVIKLCESSTDGEIEKMRDKLLGEWPDDYTFTLNVIEDMLKLNGKYQPMCIIRPSLVIPAAEEPMTGFIDKAFGLSADSLFSAIGAKRVNYFKSVSIDVIPADYVVSLMIASGWFSGLQKLRLKRGDIGSTELNVYHCISSQEKPITTDDWFGVTHTVFRDVPTSKMIQLPMQFNTGCYYNYKFLIFVLHYMMAFLCDWGLKFAGKQPMVVQMYDRIHKSQELLSPYLLKEWYFSNDNTQKLLKRMSFKDRELFNFDILKINWQSYMSSYAKGIRVYLLADPMSTLSEGNSKQNKKLIIQIVSAGILITILYAITKFIMFRVIFSP